MLFLECPELLVPIMKFLKKFIFPILQFGVPVVLLLMGMLDFAKGVMASKEDEIKKGQRTFIRRLMAALSFFFVTTLVVIVMNILGSVNISGTDLWRECWNGENSGNKNDQYPDITAECQKECAEAGTSNQQCVAKCRNEKIEKLNNNSTPSITEQCKNKCSSTTGEENGKCMTECESTATSCQNRCNTLYRDTGGEQLNNCMLKCQIK